MRLAVLHRPRSRMEWLPYCFYDPSTQIAVDLSGPLGPPVYSILPGNTVTPRPISMADSPLWVKCPLKPGQLGYSPTGTRIVSPFGIKYIYH